MNKEEKQAIEFLKDNDVLWNNPEKKVIANIAIILNLIKKQQEEIEEYKNKINKVKNRLDTYPYVAYTLYGDLLYESDEILKLLGEEE